MSGCTVLSARRGRHTIGALAATAAILASIMVATVAPFALLVGPALGAGPARSQPFTVTGAQLRWGINNESNNRAFAPGTSNFFSAGVVPDPGRGGTPITQQGWSAESGNVRIEKQQPDGSHALATWSGLGTAVDGSAIPSPTSGVFSNHQVVISSGTGAVDPAAGTASVTWSGSFTVLYYSGMSYFTVTDPTLTVTPERAQLTATAGGFASDMDDTSQWNPLPPTQVVLADLPRGQVDLAAADGFAAVPAYLGVGWSPPADESPQADGPHRGAFPSSFLDFLSSAGTAGYWYSTGGSTDRFKPALPLTVSWVGATISTPTPSATAPTPQPTKATSAGPTKGPTKGPTTTTTTTPTASPTPSATPTAQPTTTAASARTTSAPVVGGSDATVAAVTSPLAISPVLVTAGAGDLSPASAAASPSAAADPDSRALWLLGCVLLLGALATTLISTSVEGRR